MFTTEEKKIVKAEIIYSQLQGKDTTEISKLIKEMNTDSPTEFNLRSQSPEYYNWMYFRNPAGDAIVYGARHKGKLISSFAMAPKRMQIGGKIVTCGKTMDIFTNPDYQRLGLMTQLAKRVFADARKEGIYLWYVTPSKNSYPIFLNKWGYIENFEILYMMKMLNLGMVIKKIGKPKPLSSLIGTVLEGIQKTGSFFAPSLPAYDVNILERFGDETDQIWERFRHGYKVSLVRDAAFMNWRYIKNPDNYKVLSFNRNGSFCGILVLKLTHRRGLKVGEIVDYVSSCDDKQIRHDMFLYAVKNFQNDRCDVCQSWVIDGGQMVSEMKNAGLSFKRKRLKFLMSPDAPHEEFYDRDAWLLTQGDGNDI